MANLTEHVILNKWDNEINDAITSVGGDTTGSAGLPDYAKIIREQLVARGVTPEPEPGKEFILEGDSCIIEADASGCDPYNTEYAVGIKSGLIPGALYLRLCTAIKDIEPVYIDLQRISGGDISIDNIINELLDSKNFIDAVKNETIQEITQEVSVLQENLTAVQEQLIQKVDAEEVKIIVNNILEENTNNDGINVDELNW